MDLTPAQRRVAELIAHGHSRKQVASLLGISPNTVAVHSQEAYKRLGIHDRVELSIFWRDRQSIEAGKEAA